jgi:hypothetical protein
MKRLLTLTLVLMLTGSALAEDDFGMYRQLPNGNYSNFILVDEVDLGTPIQFFVTLHDASRFSIGGFEMSLDLPDFLTLNTGGIGFPVGALNVGDGDSYIVGYANPVPIQGDVFVVMTLPTVVTSAPIEASCVMGAAQPASIPGHDGPVYANGGNPSDLVAAGYVDGTPEVFLFSEVVAVQSTTFSGVKALFE